jgi:hypothetical protein
VRRYLSLVAAVGIALVVTSCGDNSDRSTSPSSLSPDGGGARAIAPGTCTTLASLTSLVNTVFSSGPNANSAQSKLSAVDKALKKNDLAGAQAAARNLISFIELKAGQGQLGGTHAQIQLLIDGILCYSGLSSDTHLIFPTDAPQIIKDPSGKGGVSLQGNTVGVPTLLTIQILPTNAPSPLITKLDQYPSYIVISSSTPLTKSAIVAVCPAGSVPPNIVGRLRLGHQAATGFEVTPPADASFLDCSTTVGASKTSNWFKRLASLVVPKSLYAATTMLDGGGVGGVATEFSPFGPVDPELNFGGGVGGTSTEFMRTRDGEFNLPGVSRSLSSVGTPTIRGTSAAITCPVVSATVGTALAPECRPVVTITTHNGTIMNNVPVSWSVTGGGGTIAPNNLSNDSCGAFGSTASTTTDLAGKASVCWILGPNAGTNTVVATPSFGGDAPAGVNFAPPGLMFTATGTKITPTAGATGGTFPYDGLAHAGSGTCSNGLTPSLSYSNGSAPVSAGSYTLTTTCGGGAIYDVATATAPIVINKLNATATAGSATMLLNTTIIPSIGCNVTGLLAAEAGVVTCTASVPSAPVLGANVIMPIVSPATPANYVVQSVNGTLLVQYKPDGCFAGLSGTLAGTSAAQSRGTLTVRCTLKDAFSVPQADKGNLLVEDIGTNGTSTPATVLSLPGAFTFNGFSNIYLLSTQSETFLSGHYFKVTSTWADGSTSTGFFLLQ